MKESVKLEVIKIVHTLIWIFFNLILIYLFYAVFTNHISRLFWVGIGIILVECVILVALNWTCPLTFLARRYSESPKENFDIYLPLWVARHNKTIYSVIFIILVGFYWWKYG